MDRNKKIVTIAVNENGERVLKIAFPYDGVLLKIVRDIPGRKYHPESKCWSAPLNVISIKALMDADFMVEDKVMNFLKESKVQTKQIELKGIPGLKGKLYPFQNKGVAFVEANKGRALIADEMGLGKTIQALAWLQLHEEKRPVIIVVPASLKLNWEREALAWLPNPRTELLSGTLPWIPTGDILIINYDILHKWLYILKNIKPQVLITDECHYYKNNGANRTKAIKMLGKGIPHVIALSGTPIVNRPIEVYNAIHLINPDLFPNFWNYTHRYCNAVYNGFGWDFNGASNTEELHQRLVDTVMIRRLKKDVLPDLPKKVRSFIPMELTNTNDYREAENNFIEFLRKRKGSEAAERASNAQALVEIEILKQLAVKGKMGQAIEWIRNFIDIDSKLVVFAVHRNVIDILMETFCDVAVKVDGSVTQSNRQRAVDSFQNNDEIRLFIGNIQAAGVGITLTASSNVAFLELPWTPGAVTQAEDRCHRIGQQDSVNIHYLLAAGTIEERIARLLDQKRKVLDAVLDGEITTTESLLSELMKQYE